MSPYLACFEARGGKLLEDIAPHGYAMERATTRHPAPKAVAIEARQEVNCILRWMSTLAAFVRDRVPQSPSKVGE